MPIGRLISLIAAAKTETLTRLPKYWGYDRTSDLVPVTRLPVNTVKDLPI